MSTIPATANTPAPSLRGLSASEVEERRRRGEDNDVKLKTSRSYQEILVSNVFNAINIILFVIGALMIGLGRWSDAVTSVGLIGVNVVINIWQEIRAKRQLDKIALISRPQVKVVRDGATSTVDPSQLVLGDTVVAEAGDQIVVDGTVVGDGKIEVDESLLTGEADLITKRAGDEVLSGSICVTGSALYEATRVGENSFASKLTKNARQFEIAQTPLQIEIQFLLRLLMALAFFIGFLIIVGAVLADLPLSREVQMAAVVAGLVPNGLFFMVILAYAMGALRIVRQGALVQQSNAVESLSNVTVLCTDKTGTLTANRLKFNEIYAANGNGDEMAKALAAFAASASANNKTGDAIKAGLPGAQLPLADEVPFSSARKWSAMSFDTPTLRGTYALGAPEMLGDYIHFPDTVLVKAAEWTSQGLRVLAFGRNLDVTKLHDDAGEPALPKLELLGLVCLSDELRPRLKETVAGFTQNNVNLKVISGDAPGTVAALARQAGFSGDLKAIGGPDLNAMDDASFAQAVNESTIFGRITPDQKERIVHALQDQGHYVAMIGDGVNDVLSLKKANMGIAMQSGSAATRSVADMILLGDSFAALPPAFTEGQRIVNGMKDIMRLFLTRVGSMALVIIATAIIGLGFPYTPKQNALLVLLTVGVPTFCLAIWSRPGRIPKAGMLKEIARFVVPAAISMLVFGLLIYAGAFTLAELDLRGSSVTPEIIAQFRQFAGIDYPLAPQQYHDEVAHITAQTALTLFTSLTGLLLVVFVEPPIQFFVAGDEYSGDKRPTILAAAMAAILLTIQFVEPLRSSFEMMPLPALGYLGILALAALWVIVLRLAWKQRWLERFLGVDLSKG